jgi:hypothetical protein
MRKKQWRTVIIGFFAALIFVFASFDTFSQSPPTDSPPSASVTVRLGGRPVFVLKTKGLAPSIERRARDVERRLEHFAQSTVPVDAVDSWDLEGITLVGAENELFLGVTDEDGKKVGKTRQVLAKEYLEKLERAVSQYRKERSAQYRLRASIFAVLSTLGLILVLVFFNKVATQIDLWLDEQRNRRIPNIRIQQLEVLSSDQLSALLKMLTKLVRSLLTLILIFWYIAFVLKLFPVTRKLGKTVFGLLWSTLQSFGNAIVNYLPNLITIVLIVLIAYYIIRFYQPSRKDEADLLPIAPKYSR